MILLFVDSKGMPLLKHCSDNLLFVHSLYTSVNITNIVANRCRRSIDEGTAISSDKSLYTEKRLG